VLLPSCGLPFALIISSAFSKVTGTLWGFILDQLTYPSIADLGAVSTDKRLVDVPALSFK
jgi:hypothetical protein